MNKEDFLQKIRYDAEHADKAMEEAQKQPRFTLFRKLIQDVTEAAKCNRQDPVKAFELLVESQNTINDILSSYLREVAAAQNKKG